MTQPTDRLRIAIYTHSLNPRGGVIHALSVAEALHTLGHQVTLVAPALPGQALFRPTTIETRFFRAAPVAGSLTDLVRQRVNEYVPFTQSIKHDFDLFHAHDGMSGFALAQLRETGELWHYSRTVHHLDHFTDNYLHEAQKQSVTRADDLFCVSQIWQARIQSDYGREAVNVANGVDTQKFHPGDRPQALADYQSITGPLSGPIVLCVGGVERRKNTLASLEAFLAALPHLPDGTTLIIAGGASLLDHSEYANQFKARLASVDQTHAIRILGPVRDDCMPALYRAASVLLFPSTVEGFGLAVLEAMASGTPVIPSNIPPFTEYLTQADAILAAPDNIQQLSDSLIAIFNPRNRRPLIENGLKLARRFTWANCAQKHLAVYQNSITTLGANHA